MQPYFIETNYIKLIKRFNGFYVIGWLVRFLLNWNVLNKAPSTVLFVIDYRYEITFCSVREMHFDGDITRYYTDKTIRIHFIHIIPFSF